MFSRRETIVGGALTLLWGGCACARNAGALHAEGCVLDGEEAEALLETASAPKTFDHASDKDDLISNSGNRAIDYALAQTLARLTKVFGVLPGFCFYDDDKGENAYATPRVKLKRADGTVLFGRRYFATLLKEVESPEIGIVATCAHEFGHIVQFKHNLRTRLTSGQPTVKRLELHADFFAGYFAGARKLERPTYPAAVFATNRFASGDDSNERGHHGTSEERAAAVVRGFETAYRERRSFTEAIGIGLNYVERL